MESLIRVGTDTTLDDVMNQVRAKTNIDDEVWQVVGGIRSTQGDVWTEKSWAKMRERVGWGAPGEHNKVHAEIVWKGDKSARILGSS